MTLTPDLHRTLRTIPIRLLFAECFGGGEKKEHLQQKKLNLTSALTTDITKLLIHHESQRHLEITEDVASHARERIQVNVLASRRES